MGGGFSRLYTNWLISLKILQAKQFRQYELLHFLRIRFVRTLKLKLWEASIGVFSQERNNLSRWPTHLLLTCHPQITNREAKNFQREKLTFTGATLRGAGDARAKTDAARKVLSCGQVWGHLPRTPQTCPLQETSPSSILAGGPHDVASCPRGCPCGVNTPPDKINPLPNHTAQNLVHCKWTSRSEAGLSPSSKMLYVTRLTDVLSSHPSSNFSSTACATFYGELTFAMFWC